jgi:hypothetical protein
MGNPTTIRLGDLAHARSGDKGDHANVAVLAYTPAGYAWLCEHLTADVVAHYFARGTVGQVARMFYRYGYSKPLVVRKLGRIATSRQLVPPAFLLTLILSAALEPWVGAARVVFGTTAAAYLLALLGCSVSAGRKAGVRTIGALALVFPVVHFCYGGGFLRCLLDLAIRSRRLARVTLPLSR